AQIAVQNPDLILAPTEGLSLVHQIVLTLGALLVEPDLARRRLPDVDAGLPRQVTGVHLRGRQGHRASPPQRAAERRRDRPRPCRQEWRPPGSRRTGRTREAWRSIQAPRVVAEALY